MLYEDVQIENIKYYSPSIVFTYKCGTRNIVELYELWKPSSTDSRFDKTDHWNFEKCGWLGCDCEIVSYSNKPPYNANYNCVEKFYPQVGQYATEQDCINSGCKDGPGPTIPTTPIPS